MAVPNKGLTIAALSFCRFSELGEVWEKDMCKSDE